MNFAVLTIENDTQRVQEVNVFDELDEVKAYIDENEGQNLLYNLDEVYSYQIKRLEDVELE